MIRLTLRAAMLTAAFGLSPLAGSAQEGPVLQTETRLGAVPAQSASSSVRLDAPAELQAVEAAPDAPLQETRLGGAPSAGSSSVRLDPAAQDADPVDSLSDVAARQTPDEKGAFALIGDLLHGPQASTDTEAGAALTTGPLATRGGVSDAEIWAQIREERAQLETQIRGPATDVMVQDSGMSWLALREGPLRFWGGLLLVGTLLMLTLFYVFRGRIRIDGPKTGLTVQRFAFIERFGHWLLGGSFILLGISGLFSLFGRSLLLPLIGHGPHSVLLTASKWVHNNVSWAFMLGLVMIFVMWAHRNIPRRVDLDWIKKAGGLFSKNSHPHAGKFNAGQKIIFWSVIVFGVSISLSGLELLFPFQIQLFSKTFEIINAVLGTELATQMSPQHEMQLAQTWHTIIAFLFLAVVFAHIYIGSIGMEGAFDAMGSGEVEVQWAREHHDLWYEREARKELAANTAQGGAKP